MYNEILVEMQRKTLYLFSFGFGKPDMGKV